MVYVATAIAALATLGLAWFGGIRRLLHWPRRIAKAVLVDPDEHTTMDERGAVRSIQAADLTLPAAALEEIWSPMHLERLARTYWRFLSRCTLGLIRVRYDDDERAVVLLTRPFVLLRFHAPEYEMDATRGLVRWRIASGVLVSQRGHDGDGYLQIEVERCARVDRQTARVHVEVEVANFYPALATLRRALVLQGDAVAHPRHRHAQLPALARRARSRRVGRRALRDPGVRRRRARSAGARAARAQPGLTIAPGRRGRPGRGE